MDFIAPPSVVDFDYAARFMARQWNEFIRSGLHELTKAEMLEGHSFFVPDGDEELEELALRWNAFPGTLANWFAHAPPEELGAGKTPDRAAEEAAELLVQMVVGYRRLGDAVAPVVVEYRQQDEYCEWKTERDTHGNVRRVTFTSESPEYWQFLESVDPSLRLTAALYTELLGETVLPGELMWPYDVLVPAVDDPSGWAVRFPAHTYNPWNDWNVRQGIVHCTHPDNTLIKAATLVASASILRQDVHGQPIDDAFPLLCAGGFGDPNRLSDPAVGFSVNTQVRLGHEVSVASPAGVYMSELGLDGFSASEGELDLRAVRHGHPGEDRILRAVLAAPDGHLLLDGEPVRTGGQAARRLTMSSAIVSRRRRHAAEAPKRRKPVAECVMSPTRRGYFGVFFPDLDWPAPWIQPAPDTGVRAPATGPRRVPTPPAHGPIQPAQAPFPAPRLDTRILNVIGTEQALDARWSRWSRWSLLSRWSGPARWSGPTRWSQPG